MTPAGTPTRSAGRSSPARLHFSRGPIPDTPGAACAGQDPEPWFSDSPDDIAQATATCRRCPDRLPCLAGAIGRRETYGIWGCTDFNPGHRQEHAA